MKKLADLLDKAFETKKRTMHKFHLFQLSEIYEWARPKGSDVKTGVAKKPRGIWLLFDCGTTKLSKIHLRMDKNYNSGKILVDTSNGYEEKYDVEGDEEKRFSTFKTIKTHINKDRKKESFEIHINNQNQQFVNYSFLWHII